MRMKTTTTTTTSKLRSVVAIFFLIATISLQASPSSAGKMQSELNNVFKSMGFDSNVTEGGSFQDQKGGYYTGGSLFARTPVRTAQLMNIQAPGFKAGCGGIDIFTGGFSYLKSEHLIAMLKNIGANASSYAFNLALQTVTPQIYNVLNELNALAQEVNNMNINSCEAAATLVGGMWPKSDASSRLLCQSMGTQYGKLSDWAEARQGCGNEGQRSSVDKSKTPFKDVLGDEFNLTWKALQKNTFFAADPFLAELFMSISGTIVAKKAGKTGEESFDKRHFSSLAINDSFFEAVIFGNGNKIKLYRCKANVGGADGDCLDIDEKEELISQTDALQPRVEGLLRSISSKIRSDEALTAREKGLVNASTLPIFKILAVQAAFRQGSSPIDINNYSEAISYDLLLGYLEDVLDLVLQSIREIRSVQIDDSNIETLKGDIHRVRAALLEKRNGVFQRLHSYLAAIEKTEQIERQLHNTFTHDGHKGSR
jgi:conjugative transfer pilus assembly protein TraH